MENNFPIILDNSDIKSKDLHEKISEKLNIKYLSTLMDLLV
jgi:hypothetical protein